MSSRGMDAGRDPPPDPDLARALAHPLRQRILERLSSAGEASPTELARQLDARLPNVAYHVRVLLELGCVELVRTRQRRGALVHYYRALTGPWFDAEQWAGLPASFRRQTLARTLRDIVSDATEAGIAGGFDPPDAQVRRTSVTLDEQSWQTVTVLVDELLTTVQRIHDAHVLRGPETETRRASFEAEIAVLLFRRASRDP